MLVLASRARRLATLLSKQETPMQKRFAFLILVAIVLLSAATAHSQSKSRIPQELEGIWITTNPANLEGNSGGETLTHDRKRFICASLIENPYTRHNFEGVLLLWGNQMITWDGKCHVYGGFQKVDDTFLTNWRCTGEHGTSGGRVLFRLAQKATVGSL
jgi:hypothetical protein